VCVRARVRAFTRCVCVCVKTDMWRERKRIAGASSTYIPLCAVVSCFCHRPLQEEKEREERISGDIPFRAAVCVCKFTRCVRVCREIETERERGRRENSGCIGIPAAIKKKNRTVKPDKFEIQLQYRRRLLHTTAVRIFSPAFPSISFKENQFPP
jgi:hypothetical protein